MSKNTKPHTLMRGNYNMRDPESGRQVRQPIGAVVELSENQARAFRDMFEPVGKGFDGIIYAAPRPTGAPGEPTQPVGPGHQAPNMAPPSGGKGATTMPPPSGSKPAAEPDDGSDVDELDEPAEIAANEMSARDTTDAMKAAGTIAEVEALADAEQARSKPRPSVLAAADKAIDALEG